MKRLLKMFFGTQFSIFLAREASPTISGVGVTRNLLGSTTIEKFVELDSRAAPPVRRRYVEVDQKPR